MQLPAVEDRRCGINSLLYSMHFPTHALILHVDGGGVCGDARHTGAYGGGGGAQGRGALGIIPRILCRPPSPQVPPHT